MKMNASVKTVGLGGRITVPKEMLESFNMSSPISVIQMSNNAISLTQKTIKRTATKVIGRFMPYSNGTVQFRATQYFGKNSKVVIYQNSKDSIAIHSL